MADLPEIILYHYKFSPYARRVVWYLELRKIPYKQCLQPPLLPRPDIDALGVSYRRIPILSMGRDIYCDTRLIIRKLEQFFPSSPSPPPPPPPSVAGFPTTATTTTTITITPTATTLTPTTTATTSTPHYPPLSGGGGAVPSSSSPEAAALTRLLERWTVDGGVFLRGSQLIPPEAPLLRDARFARDREHFTGTSWAAASIRAMRPEALAETRAHFALLEETLLADGRAWLLATEGPSLADIEAVWPFFWLSGMKGALPANLISAAQFPKVFAWIARFGAATSAAAAKNASSGNKPKTIDGAEALATVVAAGFAERPGDSVVNVDDPTGLTEGQLVEVFPIESGFRNRDRGRLVGLSGEEIVLEKRTEKEGESIRVHVPRHGFRVRAVPEGKGDAKL